MQSQCSPAQNPLVAPIDLVLFAKSGPLLRISGAQRTLIQEEKKKKHIMPEAHPHPQDNIWTLSLHWFSQLALVSANFTSYCLLFLSSCFGHIEFAVSHTLSAVSCSCALLMLFLCLECPPQFQPPDRFLFFLVLSGSITSSAVFTMPGRHRQSHFPHFVLKPPVQCFIVL